MAVKLKARLKKLEDVPEAFRELYTKVGDDYVLEGVDDADYKSRIDEFRTNNIELNKKLEKLKDVDPDKYQQAITLLAEYEKSEDAKLLKDGKLDEVVAKRTAAAQKEWEKKINDAIKLQKTAEDVVGGLRNRLQGLEVEKHITRAINEVGVLQPGALDDVLRHAGTVWRLNETGTLVALNDKGEAIYGKKPNEALTVKEWASGLLESKPFLFERAAGGGARGGKPAQNTGGMIFYDAADPKEVAKYTKEILAGKAEPIAGSLGPGS